MKPDVVLTHWLAVPTDEELLPGLDETFRFVELAAQLGGVGRIGRELVAREAGISASA